MLLRARIPLVLSLSLSLSLSLTLSLSINQSINQSISFSTSHFANPRRSIQSLRSANKYKFLQVCQHLVSTCVGIYRRTSLMSSTLLLQGCSACLFVLHGWFVRWEVSGRTSGIFSGAVSKHCSKQYTALLRSSHVAFFLSVSLKFMLCNRTIVLIRLQLGRIPFLFHQRDQISM